MSSPSLSVIVPALNEAGTIGALLADLRSLGVPHEVIVVDGGSSDTTVSIAEEAGARVLRTAAGRGRQLRAGVLATRSPMLLVLHADVRLPGPARRAVEGVVRRGGRGAHAFRLRIDHAGAPFRLVELGANLRSRVLRLPYGDQGLLVDRRTYDAVGGYADVPLMEDVLLARALRGAGGVRMLKARVLVSARRWERDGVFRRSVANLALLARFLAGASPDALARQYRSEPAAPDVPAH